MDNKKQHNYIRHIQHSIYKGMSAEEKIRIATDLYYTAREIKYAGLKNQYPHLSENEIRSKLRDIFLNARS